MDIVINYWSVVVCAVAGMIIGSIWYGPLFGKKYITAMGMDAWTPEQRAAMTRSMTMSYAKQFVSSLVTLYVLAWLIVALDKQSVMGGIEVGFWMWLGFVLPLKFSDTLWGGKKILFWLSIGGQLVTFLVAGAILGAW